MSYSSSRAVEVDSPTRLSRTPRSDQRWVYFALSSAVLAALVAGSGLKLLRHSPGLDRGHPGTSAPAATAPDFAHPFHTAAPILRLASPGLLPSTPSRARLQVLVAGRSDPFASVLTPGQPAAISAGMAPPSALPLLVPPSPQPREVTVIPAVSASLRPGPLTLPARSSPPALTIPPVGGAPQGTNALSSQSISALDQIGVTGVVQVGSQISVIISEPASPGGRRVAVGETLAGGQVRLQRVDLSSGEPLVVLRHRGNDYYRTVGLGATL